AASLPQRRRISRAAEPGRALRAVRPAPGRHRYDADHAALCHPRHGRWEARTERDDDDRRKPCESARVPPRGTRVLRHFLVPLLRPDVRRAPAPGPVPRGQRSGSADRAGKPVPLSPDRAGRRARQVAHLASSAIGAIMTGDHCYDDPSLLREPMTVAEDSPRGSVLALLGRMRKSAFQGRKPTIPTVRLLFELGLWLDAKGFPKSILATAARRQVPVFCCGLPDGPIGEGYSTSAKAEQAPVVDFFKDYRIATDIMDVAMMSKRGTSVVFLGGGVPKDFLQITATSVRTRHGNADPTPHKASIQITTDNTVYGGLG